MIEVDDTRRYGDEDGEEPALKKTKAMPLQVLIFTKMCDYQVLPAAIYVSTPVEFAAYALIVEEMGECFNDHDHRLP